MKKFTFCIILILLLCVSVYADNIKTWVYDGCLAHITQDVSAWTDAELIPIKDASVMVVFFDINNLDFDLFNSNTYERYTQYSNIETIYYADSLEDMKNGNFVNYFVPRAKNDSSNWIDLFADDSKFLYYDMMNTETSEEKCFLCVTEDESKIFFKVNCENLHRFWTYFED